MTSRAMQEFKERTKPYASKKSMKHMYTVVNRLILKVDALQVLMKEQKEEIEKLRMTISRTNEGRSTVSGGDVVDLAEDISSSDDDIGRCPFCGEFGPPGTRCCSCDSDSGMIYS